MLTVFGDPGKRDAVGTVWPTPPTSSDNPEPFLSIETTGGVNILVNGTHMFNDEFFLEGSC